MPKIIPYLLCIIQLKSIQPIAYQNKILIGMAYSLILGLNTIHLIRSKLKIKCDR